MNITITVDGHTVPLESLEPWVQARIIQQVKRIKDGESIPLVGGAIVSASDPCREVDR